MAGTEGGRGARPTSADSARDVAPASFSSGHLASRPSVDLHSLTSAGAKEPLAHAGPRANMTCAAIKAVHAIDAHAALTSRRSVPAEDPRIRNPECITIGNWTLPGDRYAGLNQDFMVIQELYTPAEIPKNGQQTYVLAICDGHGIMGDKSACFAGKALARHVYCSALRTKQLPKLSAADMQAEMRAAFLKAHQAACILYDMPPKTIMYPASQASRKLVQYTLAEDADGTKMYSSPKGCEKIFECGTTCTAAVVHGRTLCIANVGDSAAVLGRSGPGGALCAEVLTVRHYGRLESEAARIREFSLQHDGSTTILEDGYVKAMKGPSAGYELSVTRALGHKMMEECGVIPDPDVTVRLLDQHVCCLVLASDGVWDVMSPEEAVAHVMESRRGGQTAVQAARALVERVVAISQEREEEQDNTSAIVVFWAYVPAIN